MKDLINEGNIVCYKPFRNEGTLKRTDNKIQMLLNPVGFGLGHNFKRQGYEAIVRGATWVVYFKDRTYI